MIRPLHAMQVVAMCILVISRAWWGTYYVLLHCCTLWPFARQPIIAPPPGGNIVLADNGPMFKEMYANALNLYYKTVTSCTCSRPSSKPSDKPAKSRRPTAPFRLNQHPVLNAARRYIDPSYMVRSVAADTKDSHMCYLLASQVQDPVFEHKICFEYSIACLKVVHGVMHGFTQFRSAAAAREICSVYRSSFCQCLPREQQNRVRGAHPYFCFANLDNVFCSFFFFVTGTFPLRTLHARSQMRAECQ
jgi:hypothetical protein